MKYAEIWRHIHFSRWRPRRLNTTSSFVSVDVTAFRRSKSISKPNFVEISQMEAEIYFLWQSKMAWEWVSFFSKLRMCQYPWMLCYILWIYKCIFDACRLSLHNSAPSHCISMPTKFQWNQLTSTFAVWLNLHTEWQINWRDHITSALEEITNSFAVAKRPRDASCLSVVSFNSTKRRAVFYC